MIKGIKRVSLLTLITSILVALASLAWAGAAGQTGGNPLTQPAAKVLKAQKQPRRPIILAGRWRDASRRHQQACEAWCREHPECGHCSTLRNCGRNYSRLRSWTGYGQHWHACRLRGTRRQESDRNHRLCEQWCNAHKPECRKCSTIRTCGPSHRRMRSWTGVGRNWHACRWSGGVLDTGN